MSDYAKQPRRKYCQFCKDEVQYLSLIHIYKPSKRPKIVILQKRRLPQTSVDMQ